MERIPVIGTNSKTFKRRSTSFFQSDQKVNDSFFFQPKLTIGPVDDPYEREADAVADKVMRMSKDEENCTVQMKDNGDQERSGIESVDKVLQSSGQPMEDNTRSFMEDRFGYDFSSVKIHTNRVASKSAQSINALAYTSGNDIVFNEGQYLPDTDRGQRLLAHELTHVVQQSEGRIQKTLQRKSIDDFKTDLEAIGADHKKVVDELFKHPKFIPLVDYVRKCPAGTIDFEVKRITQVVNGRTVDLFGGFSGSDLTVNPKRREHATNPLELVDTIVHEMLHGILSKNAICTSASNPFPFASTIQDRKSDSELTTLRAGSSSDIFSRTEAASLSAAGSTTTSGKDLLEYFDANYGPSASRPETHYVDLNKAGLSFVVSIIKDIQKAFPKIGKETVSFDNVELLDAEPLLATRTWINNTQHEFSKKTFKNDVAKKRKIDKSTFTDREYDISAIQVVESASSMLYDPNTGGHWGVSGGVWQCSKASRFTGKRLNTYVTGVKSKKPGGAVNYEIIQHT